MAQGIKFGVCADLHVDIMHDAKERLADFLTACREADVDFIIQLGDFCYPDANRKCVCHPDTMPVNVKNALTYPTYAEKDEIISMYRNFEKPAYHVIGNHDCDLCTKEQILNYYGVEYGPYYSFDQNGFHFVVLDANYRKDGDAYISYENGNYIGFGKYLPYLPDEQLRWLEEDLKKTEYPTILFSHQRLTNEPASIKNHEALRAVIDRAPKGVLMAINGHEHRDTVRKISKTWYYNVNSMANNWLGAKFAHPLRYTEEIDQKYPNIQYTVPYKDSIYAIITVDEKGATINGKQSEFVGKTPEEMGVYEDAGFKEEYKDGPMTASVEDRYLPF